MSLKIPKNANIAAFDSQDADTTLMSFTSRISGRPWQYPSLEEFLVAPLSYKNPEKNDWAAVFVAIILVFLGATINGWVVIATRNAGILNIVDSLYLKNFIMALVSAGTFYVCTLWTYDPRLPNIIHPEIAVTMVVTKRIGLVIALGYFAVASCGFLLGGFSAGSIGNIVPTIAVPIVNSATSTLSYVVYWFGGTVIVFSYIFNYWFRQQKEDAPEKNLHHSHKRGSLATTIAIFLLTIAFNTSTTSSNGVYTFFSGHFVSGWIINTAAMPAYFAGINQAVFWWLIPLLVVPATIWVVILALLFFDGVGNWLSGGRSSKKVRGEEEGEMVPAPMTPANAKVSRRLVGRDVQVNYSY